MEEPEKQFEHQFFFQKMTLRWFLKWKTYNVAYFESKFSKRVRFWIENLKPTKLWWKFCVQRISFWIVLLRKTDLFGSFSHLLENMIFNLNIYNLSVFELKVLQGVRLWEKKFRGSQNLKQNFTNVKDFEDKKLSDNQILNWWCLVLYSKNKDQRWFELTSLF